MSDTATTPPSRVADVASTPVQQFDWGTIQWLVNGRQIADSQMTFGFVQIKPGAKNTRHYHPNCDEVLYLLEGELEHTLGDATFRLTPGMSIHIPTGVAHDATNLSAATATMVVAYSSGDRQTIWCEEGQE